MTESSFHQTFGGAATGVTICSRDGRFLHVNESYSSITGYPCSELLALGYEAVIYPEDLAGCRQLAGRLFSAEIGHAVLETRYLRKDGGVRWVRASAALLPPDWGAGEAALAIVEDLSRQKDAGLAREDGRARLSALQVAVRAAEEAERLRLAREIHDGVAQLITALDMCLGAVRGCRVGPGPLARLVAQAQDLAEQCGREIRYLSCLLHAPAVENVGLKTALDKWIAEFAKRTGVAVAATIEAGPRLGAESERAIFRIVQEFLGQVHRRSSDRAATVDLRYGDEAVLRVSAPAVSLGAAGWAGLAERAAAAGIGVEFAAGGEAALAVRIPGHNAP